jgi:hypothetical protein
MSLGLVEFAEIITKTRRFIANLPGKAAVMVGATINLPFWPVCRPLWPVLTTFNNLSSALPSVSAKFEIYLPISKFIVHFPQFICHSDNHAKSLTNSQASAWLR